MPGPSVITWDGVGEFPLGRWANIGVCELAWERYGAATARISASALEGWWTQKRSFPGWIGAFAQIDATDKGLPLWTGRLTLPQPSSDTMDVPAQLAGPEDWMNDYHLSVGNAVREPLARVVYRGLAAHPMFPNVRMKLDDAYMGAGLNESLAGRSFWELITDAMERGEWPHLEPIRGSTAHELRWLSQLSGPDRSGSLVFENGKNAIFQPVPDLQGAIDQLAVTAQALSLTNKPKGIGGRARPNVPFGRKAALQAVVNGRLFQRLAGGQLVLPRTSAASADSAFSSVEGALRQLCTMGIPAQITVTDPALWPKIRPGTIASTRWKQDPHGVFTKATVQIDTMTANPMTGEMSLSALFWDKEN